MAHSKIPKFTKSRPMGMPDTPYNPMTGKYAALGKDYQVLNVMVDQLIPDSNDLYICRVMDSHYNKSSERIKARRVMYDATGVADVSADTEAFAYKIDDKWYFQTGGETSTGTVDFAVDMFDRAGANHLTNYWNSFYIWDYHYIIYGGEACRHTSTAINASGVYAYLLSQNDRYFSVDYRHVDYYDADTGKTNLEYYVDYFLDDTSRTGGRNFSLFTLFITGPNTNSYPGLEVMGYIRIGRDIALDPAFLNYYVYLRSDAVSVDLSEETNTLTALNDIDLAGTIQFEVADTIISCLGTHFSGIYDIGITYDCGFGITTYCTNYKGDTTTYQHAIDNIKVRRSDTPEPPNESGHGKYEGGDFVYTDVYHSGGGYDPTLEA